MKVTANLFTNHADPKRISVFLAVSKMFILYCNYIDKDILYLFYSILFEGKTV